MLLLLLTLSITLNESSIEAPQHIGKIVDFSGKTMQLFIDTNIFLSFYHFQSDDLEELKKLNILITQQKIKLLLTDQVIAEFNRNRENKIVAAIKSLKELKFNFQFPQLCKDYDEYSHLREYQKQYEKEHSVLLRKISDDIKNRTLKADLIIAELFSSSNKIPTDQKTLLDARLRIDIGNPPGKNGSLGDAINWEVLLNHASQEEEIYFITDDKDYCSPIDSEAFNEFLMQEWNQKKKSQLIYYKQLSSLFKKNFPDIKLASELEKDIFIQEFANSESFPQTHRMISKLNSYTEFTSAQLNRIVEASITNSQIYWIIEDRDVKGFLSRVVSGKESSINEDNLKKLKEFLKREEMQQRLLHEEGMQKVEPW